MNANEVVTAFSEHVFQAFKALGVSTEYMLIKCTETI